MKLQKNGTNKVLYLKTPIPMDQPIYSMNLTLIDAAIPYVDMDGVGR